MGVLVSLGRIRGEVVRVREGAGVREVEELLREQLMEEANGRVRVI